MWNSNIQYVLQTYARMYVRNGAFCDHCSASFAKLHFSANTMLEHRCSEKGRRRPERKAAEMTHLAIHLWLLLLSWPTHGSQETGKKCFHYPSILRVSRTRMARGVQRHLREDSGASIDAEASQPSLSEPRVYREAQKRSVEDFRTCAACVNAEAIRMPAGRRLSSRNGF